jgi:hypothetical protein
MQPPWLQNPPDGTPIVLGFDGSDTDDHTVIRAETVAGFQFTPRVFDGRPSIWNPAEHADHRVPRIEVHAAFDELFERFDVQRLYYDPPYWSSEGEAWQVRHGESRVIPWETRRTTAMHAALERFVIDLKTGSISHDGCPITTRHIASAVKTARGRDQYGLAKASRVQKIDAAVTSVLAHEAACDVRAVGVKPSLTRVKGRVSAY